MEREHSDLLLVTLSDVLEWMKTGYINGVHYDEESLIEEVERVLMETNGGPVPSDEEEDD